jgi:dolichol kinase
VLAAAATPFPRPSWQAAIPAASAAVGWLVTALATHQLVKSTLGEQDSRAGALAALAVAVAVSVVVVLLHKREAMSSAPGVTVDGRRAAKEATVEPNPR